MPEGITGVLVILEIVKGYAFLGCLVSSISSSYRSKVA